MIGAGIGNLAAAVYLIRDGGWRGDQITILGLETHGANDGAAVKEFEGEYGHRPLGNSEGFLNRGGRMLNEETYENFWDVMGACRRWTSRASPSRRRSSTSTTLTPPRTSAG